MTWIESHQELGAHPKTKKLARLLGISRVTAIGHLHLLWWWAIDYAEDGNVTKFDAIDLATGAEWEGDEDEFVDALVSAGFLDRTEDQLVIHDWYDYAGKLIERRAANAKRMRDARAGHDARTKDERATHVQRTIHARAKLPNRTVPNPTQPNHTEPNHEDGADAPVGRVSHFPEQMLAFWNAYPGVGRDRSSRSKVLAAWKALAPDAKTVAAILGGVDAWMHKPEWSTRYAPGADRFLRERKWEEPPTVIEAPREASPRDQPKDPFAVAREIARQRSGLRPEPEMGDVFEARGSVR